ncbi:unnamed protein product, partial [Ectocarpus sp. 8 AP-2014]
ESIVKEVQQVIHRLSSPNVLKFYDWYETRNNVWLILEFCTGGDLLTLIKQDHQEPESAVRLFGVDLLAGLQQTHACGYLHGDLRPSNVLIDEYGILKLSGFDLARGVSRENEEKGEGEASLEGGGGVGGDSSSSGSRVGGEGYSQHQHQEKQQHRKKQQQQQGGASAKDAAATVVAEGRDPAYMAPELFSVGEQAMSFASDFWSLGCVLYELLTGEPPFRSSASATVAETIAREHPPGLDKGEWQGARMSEPFRDLVSRLLDKDPRGRPTWAQLLAHPFWGSCQTPSPLEMPPQPRFDRDLAPCSGAAIGSSSAAVVEEVADDSCGRAAAAAVVGQEEVRNHAAGEARPRERQKGREGAEGAAEGGGGRGDFDRALGDSGIVEVIADDASLSSSSSSLSRSSSCCSFSAEGLAGVSTIDSTSMRRRERRGVTGEWKDVSALSTDELPAEVVTEAEENSCDGDEEGRRREGEEDNDQWRHGREGGREVPAKVRGTPNVGGVRADSARHHTGREKEPGEGPGLGLGGSVPPSTRPIPGSTATERWRSANQRRSPRDREPPLTAGQHGRDGCRVDKGADGDNHELVRAPVVSEGVTAGEGGRRRTALPPSMAAAATASTSQVRLEEQQSAAAAAAVRRRAPCHDGLVLSRGCGETATTTTTTTGGGGGEVVVSEGADSSSPGGISRGRRRRRRENGAVEGDANGGVSNSVADAADAAAAKRAAATEALNGLRLRGRIPPSSTGAASRRTRREA